MLQEISQNKPNLIVGAHDMRVKRRLLLLLIVIILIIWLVGLRNRGKLLSLIYIYLFCCRLCFFIIEIKNMDEIRYRS